jgi:hypothetical protein
MRLGLYITATLVALVTGGLVRAQTFRGPPSAYENLPTGTAPVGDASNPPLTIVPPAQNQTPPPAMEGSVVEMQPWTPDGPAYEHANTPMSHAISAEPWDGGWFAAVELTIFRPVYNSLPVTNRHVSVGPRLVLGWESDRGFGLRGRFWGIENESEIFGPLLTREILELEASRFDFDLYREFDFRGSSITVGGSIGAADLKMNAPSVGPAEASGGGIGVFVEGRHLLSKSVCSEWAAVGRGRWTGLVGNWKDPANSPYISGDSHIKIVEAGLGWEYRREFENCDLVLQHLIEVQAWDPSYLTDVTLFGQNVSIGLTF